MERRDFAKAVGGIVTTGAIGGAGLLAATGGASATAGSTIANPEAVTSDDGEITYVAVQTNGRLTWDGFDEPAKYGRMQVYVELRRDSQAVWGENLIHDTGQFPLDESWGSSGEEISLAGDHEAGQSGHVAADADWGIAQKNRNHYYDPSAEDNINEDANGYGLPQDPAPVSPFSADADGSKQRTRVVLRTVYMLFDGSGTELTGTEGYPDRPEATSKFVVTVNNQEAQTGFGDGDAEGDTEDSADVGV